MSNIGAKIAKSHALGFGLFLFAVAIAIAVVQVSRSNSHYHSHELARMTAVQEIADLLSENRIAESNLLFQGEGGTGAASPLARLNAKVEAQFAILAADLHDLRDRAVMQRLKRAWLTYKHSQMRWTRVVAADRARALGLYNGVLRQHYLATDTLCDALIAEVQRGSEVRATYLDALGRFISILLLVLAALGGALSLMMLQSVRAGILQPLAAITKSLAQLAAGTIDVAVTGGERSDEVGALARALEVFRLHARALETANSQTRAAQADLENLARNDVLTGLPNRRQFIEALARATHRASSPCAVLLIDLDRFKPVNDLHGHEAGDMVLCELADRFVAHRSVLGSVARLGGDEFAVVLRTDGGVSEATNAARLITHLISQPIAIAGTQLEVGAKIGIALYPQDGSSPSALLRAADLAMYRAKAKGLPIDPFVFFDSSMHDQLEQRARLDADLRRAIPAGEVRPHYQPMVSLEGKGLVGFEILARWHHPTRGIVMPDQFIAAADERGLLTDMTYRILRQACEDARHWPEHLTMSLNLAPSQLSDPLLATRLLAILTQTGMAPQRIEIEVTENALITDLGTTKTLLSSLQSMGMTVALDDFGTGYASLYQLRDLNFDKIKIDRSFVERLAGGGEAHVDYEAVALTRTERDAA